MHIIIYFIADFFSFSELFKCQTTPDRSAGGAIGIAVDLATTSGCLGAN